MAILTNNQVYKTVLNSPEVTERTLYPTLECPGTACEIYVSNKKIKPADTTEMTLSETLTGPECYPVTARFRWIAVNSTGGDVDELGVVNQDWD